jgi:hypothetical protein
LFFYGLFAMAVSRCPMVWRDFVLMTIFVMLITAGLSQQRSDGALPTRAFGWHKQCTNRDMLAKDIG